MKCKGALLIGVGNPYRGDDGVGPWVVERLEGLVQRGVDVRCASGEGVALMDLWHAAEHVIVVDAVRSGARVGSIFRFEAHQQAVPAKFFHYSTHDFSLAEAVEMARTLGQLPPRMLVYGIEGKDFRTGRGLSSAVREAARKVVSHVLADFTTSNQVGSPALAPEGGPRTERSDRA